MPGKQFGVRKPYLSIIQGTLRQQIDETIFNDMNKKSEKHNAVKRDYELKNGNKGTKYELVFMEWYGRIEDVRLKDTQYGEQLEVEFDDAIMVINTDSRYFTDFVKKLASININQTVVVHPFDFEPEPGKKATGVAITQNDQKVKSYYDTKDENGKWLSIHGFPRPTGNTKHFKKDDWKAYFLEVKRFLKSEVERIRQDIDMSVPDISAKAPEGEKLEDHEVDNGPIREDEVVTEGYTNSEQYKGVKPAVDDDKEEVRLEDVPF